MTTLILDAPRLYPEIPVEHSPLPMFQKLHRLHAQRDAIGKQLSDSIVLCRHYRRQIRTLRAELARLNGDLAEIDDLLPQTPPLAPSDPL